MADATVRITVEITPTESARSEAQRMGLTPPQPSKQEFELSLDKEHLPIQVSVKSTNVDRNNTPLVAAGVVCPD